MANRDITQSPPRIALIMPRSVGGCWIRLGKEAARPSTANTAKARMRYSRQSGTSIAGECCTITRSPPACAGAFRVVPPDVSPRDDERHQDDADADVEHILGKGRRKLTRGPLRQSIGEGPDELPRKLEKQQRKHLQRIFEA